MKSFHDLPAPLRREETLDIGNQEDQHIKQYCYFNCVIDEELYAAADPTIHIESDHEQQFPN